MVGHVPVWAVMTGTIATDPLLVWTWLVFQQRHGERNQEILEWLSMQNEHAYIRHSVLLSFDYWYVEPWRWLPKLRRHVLADSLHPVEELLTLHQNSELQIMHSLESRLGLATLFILLSWLEEPKRK